MSTIFKVSEAASLALHAAAIIAGRGGEPVPVSEMAEVLGASEAHLSKVLQRLARAGLVHGKPGPHGGFTLTKPEGRVTLRDLYEAIEGPISCERCLFDLPVCDRKRCALSRLLTRVSNEMARELRAITLEDFRVPSGARRRSQRPQSLP